MTATGSYVHSANDPTPAEGVVASHAYQQRTAKNNKPRKQTQANAVMEMRYNKALEKDVLDQQGYQPAAGGRCNVRYKIYRRALVVCGIDSA
jgi:hypothetical protein